MGVHRNDDQKQLKSENIMKIENKKSIITISMGVSRNDDKKMKNEKIIKKN